MLLEHYRQGRGVPEYIALGFAALLAFYRRPEYPIQDDNAAYFFEKWESHASEELPHNVLSDKDFWGADLAALPGFAERVTAFLLEILEGGASAALKRFKEVRV